MALAAQVWKGDKNPGIHPLPITQPSSGVVALDAADWIWPNFRHTYHLIAARVVVTRTGAGSYGTLKLGTFPEGMVRINSASLTLTATAEGSALTAGAGNAVYKLSVGSAAVAAPADAVLTGTQVDVVPATTNITNSAGTNTGYSGNNVLDLFLDGRTTPASLNFNFSGTIASVLASSTIDITAKVIVEGVFLGDA